MRDATPERRPTDLTPSRRAYTSLTPPAADRAVGLPLSREVARPAPTDTVASLVAHAVALTRQAHPADGAPASSESAAALTRLLAQLRSSVTRYVGDRRLDGLPLERVLPEVLPPSDAARASEDAHVARHPVVAQVVRWTIEAYFDDPALRNVPRFY